MCVRVKESEELRARHAKEENEAVELCTKTTENSVRHQKWVDDQIDELNNALRAHIKCVSEAVIAC